MIVSESVELVSAVVPSVSSAIGSADWSVGQNVSPASAAVVEGFPVEGAWVRVIEENGTPIFVGWFSADASRQDGSTVAVVIVSREPMLSMEHEIVNWSGRVRREQVQVLEPVFGAAPVWFTPYVKALHAESRATTQTEELTQGKARLAQTLEELRERNQRWVDDLVEDACEWADRNSLCSEFENFMESHQLPGRERSHDVEVEVTARITVSVSARSVEAAEECIDSDDVRSHIENTARFFDFDWHVAE
jgi:hypothetical protein